MRTLVDRAVLEPLTPVGRDATGALSATPYRLRGHGPLVYEKFNAPLDDDGRVRLDALVRYRQQLPADRQARLDGCVCWPLQLVVDGEAIVGVVLPRPPSDSGPKSAVDGAVGRTVMAAKVVHAIGLLHRDGVAYGGSLAGRVLVAPAGRVMLTRPAPGAALATDRYELAAFVLGCLTPPGRPVDPESVLDVLDAAGVDLLRAGLGADPTGRPTAKQWYRYLRRHLDRIATPPVIRHLTVDARVLFPGGVATVDWTVDGGIRTYLRTPGGPEEIVEAGGRAAVTMTRTGSISLRAENEFGSVTASTEPVYVLEPPRLERLLVPEPASADQQRTVPMADLLWWVASAGPPMPSVELPAPVVTLPDFPALAERVRVPDAVAGAYALPTIDVLLDQFLKEC